MEVFDLIRGEDGDLVINNGDFAVEESTLQHQADLLIAVPGDIRMHSLIGCGLRIELLDDTSPDEMSIRIQQEMERDGMEVETLEIKGNADINLIAKYADQA